MHKTQKRKANKKISAKTDTGIVFGFLFAGGSILFFPYKLQKFPESGRRCGGVFRKNTEEYERLAALQKHLFGLVIMDPAYTCREKRALYMHSN